jgi:AcrR family transcriptional regulator
VPKLVDHEARRVAIAEAVWRVIRRDGLARASVRGVARESGLSAGSLRHVFATQSELLAFSMRLVAERIEARVRALVPTGDVRRDAEAAIHELLPLDDDRRAEAEVWLAFAGQALVDERLRALREEVDGLLHRFYAQLIDALADAGALARGADADPDVDRALEAERLGAVIDGLVVHALMRPDRADPARQRAVIAHHLDALAPGS